jgi:hypothetical protein
VGASLAAARSTFEPLEAHRLQEILGLVPKLVGSHVADPAGPPEPKETTQFALPVPVCPSDRPGRRVPPRLGETLLLVEVSGDVVRDYVHGLLDNTIGTGHVPCLPRGRFPH